ncbi:MAG TPA: haloalkane dehalogenase [Hyphomicrobiales bacterium]|nr:haloalkane dehalogenase [Hyphomicrobiales bacterium]
MRILRTPDDCFSDLPGFPFAPHYLTVAPAANGPEPRIHYVDEGPSFSDSVFLCLHGQPTWAYLYRKMIPLFTAAGGRAVAPDLAGFGRSDKPAEESVYTFTFHREVLIRFIEKLDLRNITLVCQDWGGLLGLTLPMDMPERFSRLIVMNTALATGDFPLSEGFLAWRAFSNRSPDMDIAALMKRAVPFLTDAEARAYAAPFPDATYKAGVRRFPNLVPDNPEAEGAGISRRAREWLRSEWRGKTFMATGMMDPVLGAPAMKALANVIRGCPAPLELENAGHFVQESGEAVAEAALAYFGGA